MASAGHSHLPDRRFDCHQQLERETLPSSQAHVRRPLRGHHFMCWTGMYPTCIGSKRELHGSGHVSAGSPW